MALLPLACEPLEYLNGRLGREDKQQDKVSSPSPDAREGLMGSW
jgi:hypothetical protein